MKASGLILLITLFIVHRVLKFEIQNRNFDEARAPVCVDIASLIFFWGNLANIIWGSVETFPTSQALPFPTFFSRILKGNCILSFIFRKKKRKNIFILPKVFYWSTQYKLWNFYFIPNQDNQIIFINNPVNINCYLTSMKKAQDFFYWFL